MKILEISPDKNLRLCKIGRNNGVVELQIAPGLWRWCVWRSVPLEKARELFSSQSPFHQASQ